MPSDETNPSPVTLEEAATVLLMQAGPYSMGSSEENAGLNRIWAAEIVRSISQACALKLKLKLELCTLEFETEVRSIRQELGL